MTASNHTQIDYPILAFFCKTATFSSLVLQSGKNSKGKERCEVLSLRYFSFAKNSILESMHGKHSTTDATYLWSIVGNGQLNMTHETK